MLVSQILLLCLNNGCYMLFSMPLKQLLQYTLAEMEQNIPLKAKD